MVSIVRNNILQIRDLCVLHKVESFCLFGSAAKGTLSEGSDIDFLVRFSNSVDLIDYADNYFDLLSKLKEILKRDVDLVTESSLTNPYLINDINQSKISLYES